MQTPFRPSSRRLVPLLALPGLLLLGSSAARAANPLDFVWARGGPTTAEGGTPNHVRFGDGAGGQAGGGLSFLPPVDRTAGVALGLVDGDPYMDIVFANLVGHHNRLCLGDGFGDFSCSDLSTDPLPSQDVALGYVDGDSHLDAVFANPGFRNRVCLGDGSGGFTCSDVSTDSQASMGVALGFVDGDAHLDAVFANGQSTDETNTLCLGDGAGGFSCSPLGADSHQSKAVALAFVDADGHLDAVFANGTVVPGLVLGQKDRVCLGDGLGGFTCSDLGLGTDPSQDVALGLVDGDAHLDAVFAMADHDLGMFNRICLGDGAGGFSCSSFGGAFPEGSFGVALGLVDGDAHLDALFGNAEVTTNGYDHRPDSLCLGDGAGGFSCSSFGPGGVTNDVALGFLDVSICGNGTLEFGEACDNGDTDPGDCCDDQCQYEAGPGTPGCCLLGDCQIGLTCGAVCFEPSQLCQQPGGVGSDCLCASF